MIYIYDTTLRDGMQGMGINFVLGDKLEIAYRLDEMQIDYIEGGFPQSNPKEELFFRECLKHGLKHAKLAAFGATRRPNIKAEADANLKALLDSEAPVATVVGKSWKSHIKKVIQTSPEENLRMIADSTAFLKKHGREVVFDFEHFFDGYKDDSRYAIEALKTATEAGADALVLCDTNGGSMPNEINTIYGELPKKELAPLGGHFHNDCGVGVANSLVAVTQGAIQIQGTINGWGERVGNANLCTIMANLCIKMGKKPAMHTQLDKLTSLSRFVAEKANIIPDSRQPFVGEAAFSHKAGQHADVVIKAANLMEHTNAALVGNQRRVLLSELAGKSTILFKISKYGDYNKTSTEIQQLIDLLKARENEGYEYEAAEASFDLLIRQIIGRYTPLFKLRSWHIESFKSSDAPPKTIGKIFVDDQNKEISGVAVGGGPVEALDSALKDALSPQYGFLTNVSLVDYRVRVLNPEKATGAKVRVFISCSSHQPQHAAWDTVGVHNNIIEASWQALLDSYEYYYNTYLL